MNLKTSVQLCKNIQTKFDMATSKVLSIALFVLLGLSMCSATRKLYQEGSGGLPAGLPGVPSEEGLADVGGIVGGLPVVGPLVKSLPVVGPLVGRRP